MELYGNSTRVELNHGAHATNENSEFARDVAAGLRRQPKRIPAKYHYDARGSELFELITCQPEYDLTRKEFEILETHAPSLMRFVHEEAEIIELGPGSGFKAITLLRHGLPAGQSVTYRPFEVSPSALTATCRNFSNIFSHLECRPLQGDFLNDFSLEPSDEQRVVLFLGSSIGNFDRDGQVQLISSIARELKPGDLMITGFDLVRDVKAMNAAYNDAAGVTEEFNFNLLDRMNAELGADFDRRNFSRHSAFDPKTRAVETHLIALVDHTVEVAVLDEWFQFKKGEALHVESSHKFASGEIALLARRCGFESLADFHDESSTFCDSVWRKI